MPTKPTCCRVRGVPASAALLLGASIGCATLAGGATASSWAPAAIGGRFSLGHDSNLLDASDLERAAFESGDPGAFFLVDRMADQFLEAEVRAEWKPPRAFGGRPSLRLGWERRQFVHNPIKSEDQLTLSLRARPGGGTRVTAEASLRPQVYDRHRIHRDAMPGEPRFRPEVHRRWDLELEGRQGLGRHTNLDAVLEGSTRRYRAPFQERDRKSFAGGGGLARSLGAGITLRADILYRATWTENEPWDPDDRSHRVWRASSGVELRDLPLVKAVSLGLDLEWRRFTSTDPDDQDHFGRRDRGGEAELEVVRGLAGTLDWVSRAAWRWRSSNFPEAVLDEEGVFDETVFRTGVAWEWERE